MKNREKKKGRKKKKKLKTGHRTPEMSEIWLGVCRRLLPHKFDYHSKLCCGQRVECRIRSRDWDFWSRNKDESVFRFNVSFTIKFSCTITTILSICTHLRASYMNICPLSSDVSNTFLSVDIIISFNLSDIST